MASTKRNAHPLTSCKKSEKSLEFLRKLRYQPINEPMITNNTDLIGPRWRRSKNIQKKKLLLLFYLYNFY